MITAPSRSPVRRSPTVRALFAAALVAPLLVVADASAGARPGDAPAHEQPGGSTAAGDFSDRDGDKVFESLERVLETQRSGERVDVIVQLSRRPTDSVINSHRRDVGHFETSRSYRHIDAYAARLTPGQVRSLAERHDVTLIQEDAEVRALIDTATSEFGTDNADTDFAGGTGGNTDENVTYSEADVVIAVIDTGIDSSHPALDEDKVIASENFLTPPLSSGCSAPSPPGTDDHDHGHGTHVASIAAGTGEGGAPEFPDLEGVAPGAALVSLKALDCEGNGRVSDINAAIDWAIDNQATYGIDVVNMSLGVDANGNGTDSTSLLVDEAVDAGIVVTVAAGNDGPATGSVGIPAVATKAITVGNMADPLDIDLPPARGFRLAETSSRGPTLDGRVKPDVVAPGVAIYAARRGGGYQALTGTSMAAPFVAGTAALMIDAAADDGGALTPDQIKNAIKNTAEDWGPAGADNDYGSGRLDGYAAVEAAGTPGVLALSEPPVPTHRFGSECLIGTGDVDTWSLTVPDDTWPVAVTLLFSGSGTSPNFNLELRKPDGSFAASSASSPAVRQESFAYPSTSDTFPEVGTYTLRVTSASGGGSYTIDTSSPTSIASPGDGCPKPTTTTTKPKATTTTTTKPKSSSSSPAPAPASDPVGSGYSLVDDAGGLFNFGDARFFGSVPGLRQTNPGLPVGDVVGGFPTHDGGGYVIFDDDGRVFPFGKARNLGSVFDRVQRGIVGRSEITGGFPVNDGAGYILIDLAGGVHTFGTARFFGSVPGLRQTHQIGQARVIDGFSTHDGAGYVLVDDAGGLFNFGRARFLGSVPQLRQTHVIGEATIVGGFATHGGDGYVVIDDAGGLFNFGKARFLGSVPQLRQTHVIGEATVVGGFATHGGDGYVVVDDAGGLFNFGKAKFLGSIPGLRLAGQTIGQAVVVDGFAV